jgi:hypothetical protein
MVDTVRNLVGKVLDHYGLDPGRGSEAGSLVEMNGGPLPGPPAGGGDRPPPKRSERDPPTRTSGRHRSLESE